MRVDLNDGQWAEFKDIKSLNTGDKLAVRRATLYTVRNPEDDKGRYSEITGAYEDEKRIALLTRVITEWSFPGWAIPSMAMDATAAIEQLPLDAYEALCEAIDPYLEALEGRGPSA